MRLEFSLDGLPGHVEVEVAPVGDREAVGAWPAASGLPSCTATVSYPGPGYRGMFGWVQLVRSTDNSTGGEGFDLDPLEVLGEVSYPFGFVGIRPTLYDAPSRDADRPLEWTAHSFLTAVRSWLSPDELDRILRQPEDQQETTAMEALRMVRALVGFSWGFSIADGRATIAPTTVLGPDGWNAHIPHLTETYPSWSFAADFHG
jgi:hypothetical protein